MVERTLSMREAAGSMPAFSTSSFFAHVCRKSRNINVALLLGGQHVQKCVHISEGISNRFTHIAREYFTIIIKKISQISKFEYRMNRMTICSNVVNVNIIFLQY